MNQITEWRVRLSQEKRKKALSGQEILEALVAIADEADKRVTPEMFQEFWKPLILDNVYGKFVRDRAADFRLNEMPLYEPVEPISGYNRHHYPPKRNMRRILPYLHITDQKALDKVKEEEELLLVSYHIWYVTSSSRNYFHTGDVSRFREFWLRMSGMREQTEVEKEIVDILARHQINPKTEPLEIVTSLPRDLFSYKGRLLTLGRKIGKEENDGRWVDVVWGLGVYTKEPELIGYILFNKETEERRRILLM